MDKIDNTTPKNEIETRNAELDACDELLDLLFGGVPGHIAVGVVDPEDRPGLPISEDAFFNAYAHPRKMNGPKKLYMSTAVLNLGELDGEPRLLNRTGNLSALTFFVLDDIGTKCPVDGLPEYLSRPTYIIESSEGNYQYGYKLKDPITDPGQAAAFITTLYRSGEWDAGGPVPCKFVRLPAGVHGKTDFRVRLEGMWPDRLFDVAEVLACVGHDDGLPEEGTYSTREGTDTDDMLDFLVTVGEALPTPGGEWPRVRCPWADEHSTPGDHAGYLPGEGIFKCLHGHCAERGMSEYRSWLEGRYKDVPGRTLGIADAVEAIASLSEGMSPAARMAGRKQSRYTHAQQMLIDLDGQYLFARGRGWLGWDGQRWGVRRGGNLQRDVHHAVMANTRLDLVGPASPGYIRDVMDIMAADMFAHFDEFDVDNYMMATPDGTLDLLNGRMLAPDPSRLISYMTKVAPQLGVPVRFLKFMDEVTDGDQEMVDFMQGALGSMLSGAIEEHWIMFWIGVGRNGKNTLGDLVEWILGDYAGHMPSSTLMSKKHQEHATELMLMKGRRVVTSSEIQEGTFWNASRLNEVTGDENITARYMRQDYVTFTRTHKHLVYGNHRPLLREVTPALVARIKVVPFKVSFLGREDGGLPAELRREAPQIMQWLVEGHAAWMANGKKIGSCAAVDEETKDYFDSQVTLDDWIYECCDVDANARESTEKLFKSHTSWKASRNEYPLGMRRFSEELSGRFKKVEVKETGVGGKRQRGFEGIAVKHKGTTNIIPGDLPESAKDGGNG